MFAHQVIEALRRMEEAYSRAKIDPIIGSIREAHKFHFGSVERLPLHDDDVLNVWSLAKTYWQLPYKTCWFDFTALGEETGVVFKVAYLVMGDGNEMVLLVFTGKSALWFWSAGFIMTRVQSGECPYKMDSFGIPIWGALDKEHREDTYGHCNDVLRLLILLNCKNVLRQNNKPSERLNKKRRVQGRQELFSYHVLKLHLSGDRQSVILGQAGPKKRIHFCRGHFKQYTAERPLLGKHVGLYFWPAHIRGRNINGVVMKDYIVEP